MAGRRGGPRVARQDRYARSAEAERTTTYTLRAAVSSTWTKGPRRSSATSAASTPPIPGIPAGGKPASNGRTTRWSRSHAARGGSLSLIHASAHTDRHRRLAIPLPKVENRPGALLIRRQAPEPANFVAQDQGHAAERSRGSMLAAGHLSRLASARACRSFDAEAARPSRATAGLERVPQHRARLQSAACGSACSAPAMKPRNRRAIALDSSRTRRTALMTKVGQHAEPEARPIYVAAPAAARPPTCRAYVLPPRPSATKGTSSRKRPGRRLRRRATRCVEEYDNLHPLLPGRGLRRRMVEGTARRQKPTTKTPRCINPRSPTACTARPAAIQGSYRIIDWVTAGAADGVSQLPETCRQNHAARVARLGHRRKRRRKTIAGSEDHTLPRLPAAERFSRLLSVSHAGSGKISGALGRWWTSARTGQFMRFLPVGMRSAGRST